jgi:hypothetical protein
MADENKKSKKHPKQPKPQQDQAPVEAAPTEPKSEVVPPGERGEVGQPTAGLTIKQQWHEAHFTLKDVGDKHNPRKRVWVRNHGAPSLKRYARDLAKSGNQTAKDWFDHKAGSLNEERSEKNRTRISLEKTASKAARRKKSQGKQGKAAADATAATATAAVAGGKKGKR